MKSPKLNIAKRKPCADTGVMAVPSQTKGAIGPIFCPEANEE